MLKYPYLKNIFVAVFVHAHAWMYMCEEQKLLTRLSSSVTLHISFLRQGT